MIRWVILGILTFILFLCNAAQNYTIGTPLAFIVLLTAVFFMTPVIIKQVLDDESILALIGLIFLNSIPVFVASTTILQVFFIDTTTLDALGWALKYIAMAGLAYFAVRQIVNS